MSFILNKYYKQNTDRTGTTNILKRLTFNFSINDNIDYKYLLEENEENEITELLRKFNMYDEIRFIDGIAYNITVANEPSRYIPVDINEEELYQLLFEEVTDRYAFIGNQVYDLEIKSIPYHSELTNYEIIGYVGSEIFDKLI